MLGRKSCFGQVMIEQTRHNFVCNDGLYSGHADVNFSPSVRGRVDDGIGRDFRLIDRRNRLRFARQTAARPGELGRIQRGHLYHADADVAPFVEQFTAQ